MSLVPYSLFSGVLLIANARKSDVRREEVTEANIKLGMFFRLWELPHCQASAHALIFRESLTPETRSAKDCPREHTDR